MGEWEDYADPDADPGPRGVPLRALVGLAAAVAVAVALVCGGVALLLSWSGHR